MPAAALIAGGLIGSALISSDAVGSAADTQAQAAADTNALNKYIFDTQFQATQPWRDIGKAAIGQLTTFTQPGADISALIKSQPGYQFGLDQGQNAIERSAAAQGSLNSGGTLQALTRFGQDYAQSQVNNYFNRLSSLAGLGQVGNDQLASAGQNYANQVGNNNRYAANAQANGAIQQGNIFSGALGGLTGLAGNYLNQSSAVTPMGQWLPFGDVATSGISAAPITSDVSGLVTPASLPAF